ncbi:hypothetical protein ACTQ54_10140 [Fundicoccus sp. Sow4_H7]|uniref:hypothetical protein n=1 Tax=Fundicoccus sp. Sow4_H7 TaxID=3438784 RepID=UPI003F8FE1E4
MTTENKTMKIFEFIDTTESMAYTCDIETGICGPIELNKEEKLSEGDNNNENNDLV